MECKNRGIQFFWGTLWVLITMVPRNSVLRFGSVRSGPVWYGIAEVPTQNKARQVTLWCRTVHRACCVGSLHGTAPYRQNITRRSGAKPHGIVRYTNTASLYGMGPPTKKRNTITSKAFKLSCGPNLESSSELRLQHMQGFVQRLPLSTVSLIQFLIM